jgi:hypothetical protein
MKLPLKVGLIAAAIWISIKLAAFYLSLSLDDLRPFVFINMFILTAAIAIALYLVKRKETENNLLNDVKNGMLAGVPYAVIVSVFLYFYYEKIYPDFIERRLNEHSLELSNPQTIKKIQRSIPEMENKSFEEIKKEDMEKAKDSLKANRAMLLSMLSLLLYATLNSIVISVIFRRIVFRN